MEGVGGIKGEEAIRKNSNFSARQIFPRHPETP